MAFEELKEQSENIQEHAKGYIDTSIEYYKLKGFKVFMKSTTMVVKFVLIVLCLLMVLLFCSIAGAFAIGDYLDNMAFGFRIVGVFYIVITGLLFSVRDRIVDGPILEKFSEIFFND